MTNGFQRIAALPLLWWMVVPMLLRFHGALLLLIKCSWINSWWDAGILSLLVTSLWIGGIRWYNLFPTHISDITGGGGGGSGLTRRSVLSSRFSLPRKFEVSRPHGEI